MGKFDTSASAPGSLRKEALDITLRLDRISSSTARIQWNIPTPSAGCSVDTQAYDGIVVVVATSQFTPANAPKDNEKYIADTSVDSDLHAGDRLGGALVVGAFYHDRHTTYVDVHDMALDVPYYAYAFPVDAEYRYHKEGVHAYVLSTDRTGNATADKPASQIVELDPTIVSSTTPSFSASTTSLTFAVNDKKYSITIDTSTVATYQQLVDAINTQLATVGGVLLSPSIPNAGTYVWADGELSSFDGTSLQPLSNVIVAGTDPTTPPDGAYWVDTTSSQLHIMQAGAWVPVGVANSTFAPTSWNGARYWFDGTRVYKWNGAAWCETIATVADLAVNAPPEIPYGAVWMNSKTGYTFQWATGGYSEWEAVSVLYAATDPNLIAPGTHWFNDAANTLSVRTATGWDLCSNVRIAETTPSVPAPNTYWFNPRTAALKQFDGAVWADVYVLVWDVDPSIRLDCDLWWDSTADLCRQWDITKNAWVAVAASYDQALDPSVPTLPDNGTAWYSTSSGKLTIWDGNRWASCQWVSYPSDPRAASVWNVSGTWYQQQANVWQTFAPLQNVTDPQALPVGTLWMDPASLALRVWNGSAWIAQMFQTSTPSSPEGTIWYNTTTGQHNIMTRNGWEPTVSYVRLVPDWEQHILSFHTRDVGSSITFALDEFSPLFNDLRLTAPITVRGPTPGFDGVSDTPMWAQVGVGTDGTDNQRLQLADQIRQALGYPTVEVELTPQQIDNAIRRALDEYRLRSGGAYLSGMVFLEVKANQQHYLLTSKSAQMNKIVQVAAAHRMQSSFLSQAAAGGAWGQIALQHLYSTGGFNLLGYHLMSSYMETLELLFASKLTFRFNETTRELAIFHHFSRDEIIVLDVVVERSEQDLMTDRWSKNWIERFALAQSRITLAEVRGKFSNINGPNGGINFNAQDLRQAANDEIEKLYQEIDDYVASNLEEWGAGAQVVMG